MSNSTERQKLRKRLLANGYRPLPLLDKGIRIKGWSTADINAEWIDRFARSGRYKNTGMRCDKEIAFDIDVYDEGLANEIEEIIERECGPTEYCRVGHWPKRLLLYRLVGETIRSARTGKYDHHQVELLAGSGRQFAAFGIHPGTGEPYRWEGLTPEDTPQEDLPPCTGRLAQEVLQDIEQLFEAKGLTRDAAGSTIGRTGLTVYDLEDHTPIHLVAGAAVTWAELKPDLTEAGVWCNLERENGRFGDSDGCHAFLAKGTGTPTIHDFPRDTTHQDALKVVDFGPPPAAPIFQQKTVLDDMVEKWVLFNDQTMRRVNHPTREYTVQGMKTRLKATTVPTPTRINPNKTTPIMDVWLSTPNKLSADYAQLRPDMPTSILIDQGEETIFNLYRPPQHVNRLGEADTFFEFMAHLIPSDTERELFFDWLATKVTRPSWRMHGMVMVTREFGTGRGTLFQIVERLLGIQYVKSMDYDDLIGHTSQSTYNDYFANSLVVTVGEVFEKVEYKTDWDARKIAYERLKSICEPVARPMHIKRKYGRNTTEMVYASLLVSSNHDDALAIEPGDRRLIVLDNTRTKLVDAPGGLFERIEAWQEVPENIGRLYGWLETRGETAITRYDPFGDPPDTAAKRRMIDAGRSDLDQLFGLFVEQCKGDVCVHYQWEMFARKEANKGGYDLPKGDHFERGLKALIIQNATRFDHLGKKQIKVDGKPERPWIIRNFEAWKGNTLHTEIRAEIMKNGPVQADVTALKPRE